MPPARASRAVPKREPKRRVGYEARRALIVEAAMGVFAEHGYHAASLGEIARRADITKPVMYDHFESKKSLYLFLLEQQRDELLGHIKARMRDEGPPAQRIARTADAVFEYVELHPFAWLMLFRESTGDPEVIEIHRRIQHEASERVVKVLLAGGQPDFGGANRKLMAAATGELLGGGMRALARWWYDNRQVPREHVVALVMDVYWQGLERFRGGKRWRGNTRKPA